MTELNKVLLYLDSKPTMLQAEELPNSIRMNCFVIQKRLREAIDLDNPEYRTLADLTKEVIYSVKEMSEDVEGIINQNYPEVLVVDDIKLSDAVSYLSNSALDNHQNCIEYLTDLSVISLATLESNGGNDNCLALLLESFIYISVMALRRIHDVLGQKEERDSLKGVEVDFVRRRRDAG